jgi:hypothetical protein
VCVKNKIYSITYHEGTEEKYRYSSTLSLISPLEVGVVDVTLQPLYYWE